MLGLPIYLDNNATTQMDERVLDAMKPFFITHFGNAASRSHSFGWEAEEAVDYAREQVAQLISAEPKEIIFTSGATESCNLALKGVFEMYATKGNHIITVSTEHNAVLDTCRHIEKMGGDITFLDVNNEGFVDLKKLEAAIRPETILISVMYANNEIGIIQPINKIGEIAKKHGVLFFSDATQAIGKIPVNVINDHIDLMAFSAHKIYGPKGTGALYVRRKNPRVRLTAQMDGGGHERGMRSGTLNVPGIVGLGKACELCRILMMNGIVQIQKMRNKLEMELLQLDDVFVNGSTNHRLPNISNLGFKNMDGDNLLIEITKTLAVSTGSACTSATLQPSHVLLALGLDEDLARSSIRFGLGRFTTEEEIDFAIDQVKEIVLQLKNRLAEDDQWKNPKAL